MSETETTHLFPPSTERQDLVLFASVDTISISRGGSRGGDGVGDVVGECISPTSALGVRSFSWGVYLWENLIGFECARSLCVIC